MVKLWSALVGAAGSAFDVTIDESESVNGLKEAIKAKKKNTITCDADELQLYLAKKGDAWMTENEVKGVRDANGLKHLDAARAKLRRVELSGEHLGEVGEDDEAAGNGPVNVLVVVPTDRVTVLMEAEKRDAKRQKVEEAPDIWMAALHDERVDILPLDREGLQAHLERELRVKIPITDRLSQIVSVHDTEQRCAAKIRKLFEPCQAFSVKTGAIVASVIEPMTSGSDFATEATYHHLWDSLIATVLRRVSSGNFRRNSNASTSTDLCRPDLCFYYAKQNVCVFRGEEKSSGEMQVQLKKLYEKLIWKYDDAPYVFGYAAVGYQVCLVVIRKDSAKPRGAKAEVINHYDLKDCVVKEYPSNTLSNAIINNLKSLHGQMKEHSVPNVVTLVKANLKKRHVLMAPIGLVAPPSDVKQLVTALRDILTALVALHKLKLMHRDLRWDNVLKYQQDRDEWFLIDFDEGASAPATQGALHLDPTSHAPEIASPHSVKVDIWGVGYLLQTTNVLHLPHQLDAIQEQCFQKNPAKRPTAASLLKAVQELALA